MNTEITGVKDIHPVINEMLPILKWLPLALAIIIIIMVVVKTVKKRRK